MLLSEIYVKRFKKPFPVEEGFFCENSLEGSKVLDAVQRERRYSDEIQDPNDFGAQVDKNKKLHNQGGS